MLNKDRQEMSRKRKIIIVDDSRTFRNGLKFLIENKEKYEIIGEAANGDEFSHLKNIDEADIIFMDLNMPDSNGIEIAKRTLWDKPFLNIIAITMYTDNAYMIKLLEAGFKGCIFKTTITSDFDMAVEKVMRGKYFFPKNIKINK